MEKIGNFDLTVYPNPASSQISINTHADSEYQITNLQGIVVKEGTGNRISIAELSQGVYFIKAQNTVKRFVIQK